ncbi:hypothetical protein CLIB1423_03S06326 [[Candida] railenensis]|uniref:Uncharacterized protein n=1 Tax=[Candida] railenensis TaxID=45579 RepID=A0A9P0VXE2_9ASCO|nr:hypothetical protein CLIB1423_03S06326 [[Candida] railenensis]
MDFTSETNLLGHKLMSDISLDSTSVMSNATTSGGGSSFDTTPNIANIWSAASMNQSHSLASSNFTLNTPSFILSQEQSYNSPFTRNSSISRKGSMNVNAPSYVPVGSSTGNYMADSTFNNGSIDNKNYTYQHPQPQNNHLIQYSRMQLDNFPTSRQQENMDSMPKVMKIDNVSGSDEHEMLKQHAQTLQLDLDLRNQMIESLVEQISASSTDRVEDSRDGSIRIPNNYLQLFETLNKKYKEKSEELEQTKERLESIVTAISMNSQRARTFNGYYDEEEISHKIISKLSALDTENENLLKIISSSNKSSLIIEIGLLRDENNKLKGIISENTK